MSHRLVYITASSEEEALKIARDVVERRLAACANVLGKIRSVYWWQGAVQEEGEAALIVKTRVDLLDALTQRVKEIHSYTLPCIVALPIEGGNPAFLDWIDTETNP